MEGAGGEGDRGERVRGEKDRGKYSWDDFDMFPYFASFCWAAKLRYGLQAPSLSLFTSQILTSFHEIFYLKKGIFKRFLG